ncbi:MAG: branched-chain amino acid ABC transporter ATP-binding protein [Deltaproteobacteria bacterium RBG_16_48_10]|nr:MAG: branched-chain amino acid ABC transporter ATP-binding protein [Deltaproteobacteria bacterium RBG_16_48_10]
MLEVKQIQVAYDEVPVLRDVSFNIKRGQVVCIIGSNGTGKSTILRTISGLLNPTQGSISFNGVPIQRQAPHVIAGMGVAHVPEGRRLFARLSVLKNLHLGAYTKKSAKDMENVLHWIYTIFPVLEERKHQKAGTLSGGEQQMLAIARGLMLQPKLLMLDEPSLGLMPKLVTKIFETIEEIKKQGLTILLVEQKMQEALELADYGYVIQSGKIVMEGVPRELTENELVKKTYLGM